MTDEERFKRIEEAIVIMKDLLLSHENRLDSHGQHLDDHGQHLDDYYKAMRESRNDFEFKLNALSEDFNFKLNALIDSQIRNEVEIRELKEASKSQLKRIEKIENK
jgi:hypothetical protein